jgi:hypothetical protein
VRDDQAARTAPLSVGCPDDPPQWVAPTCPVRRTSGPISRVWPRQGVLRA